MKSSVWQYEDPVKQTVHFRGYVKTYKEATVINHPCTEVRGNKWKALEDAEKLKKKLKTACQKSNQMSSLEKQ